MSQHTTDQTRHGRRGFERYRSRLQRALRSARSDVIKSAAEVLVDRLVSGESVKEATQGAETALRWVTRDLTSTQQREWDTVRQGVLAEWVETIGKDTKEGVEVAASLPKRPSVDPKVRDSLLEAARSTNGWAELEKPSRRLADLLARGEKFAPSSARAWREFTRDVDEETRRARGREWATTSRAIQTKWAETHPEDAPTPVKAPADQTPKRLKVLVDAGETVRSWPLLQPEGSTLAQRIAEGASYTEALKEATSLLEERREKVSEAEWELVRHEWANISEAVRHSLRRLPR